jgi:spermidine/putrescine transport system substrate-binding protein
MKKIRSLVAISLCCAAQALFAADDSKTVNVYAWSEVIPDAVIQQFEKETGIKVNFSTFDSNEVMYTKLKTNSKAGYDVIEPSSYYIDRMRREGMLAPLDKSKLENIKNMNSEFMNQSYDPRNTYSLPFVWGVTGIFVNKSHFDPKTVTKWSDLWDKKYADKLLMLDDNRELFSAALLTLGYSANDNNPDHIKKAFLKLKELMPNIKLFNSEVVPTLIDEDAYIGMAWNGDAYKASTENSQITFIYPKDGFVIWVDNFAMPINAPHSENAYKFLNFMMRADVARDVAIYNNFPTPNEAGQKLLPEKIRNNPVIYPSKEVLSHGQFQTDVGDKALALYEKYWEQLKMRG